MQNFTHKSVLLAESINLLNIHPTGTYLDLTFGRGGHSRAILNQLTTGKLIAFDKDLAAVEYAHTHFTQENFEIIHSDFSQCYEVMKNKNLLGKIDGILLDLGVSSPQLDDKSRGFSFAEDAYLDMRMDTSQTLDAKMYLEQVTEEELANVLYRYGEEKKSRQIARKIKEFQAKNELCTTKQLADIVASIVKVTNKHPATRTFQAVRIAVNNELGGLETFLHSAAPLLANGGVLAIISFHSLEDRMVKSFFQAQKTAPYIPKNLPIIESFTPTFKVLKKIKASAEELKQNPRSRSAFLRGGVKC